ncbi:MAG TPA: hypothetical protein VHX43_17200 [Xanthobacteraceae bacterium]|nr:hypothetical protein [Xanthobacteraceae bacterium]
MLLRSNHCCLLAALVTALGLAGCADVDFDSQQAWFAKKLDFTGQKGGYTFSELQEARLQQRPITANDLVNPNGSCPAPAALPPAPPAPGQAATPPAPVDTAALLGGGVALGMSECDVVFRAGQPSSVQIGKLPNGDRSTVLTFDTGPRSGVYRFERGALKELDALPMAAAPLPVAKKKTSKSAKAKASKSPKKNDT